jgi:hypothetical protein
LRFRAFLTQPRQETGLLAKVIDECFYDAWYKDKETGEKVYTCAYDWEQDLPGAQQKSARLLGMAWRQMCRNGDPLPKLQRYETALSNRIMKAVKLLLKLRGHDRPGELQNAELRNERRLPCGKTRLLRPPNPSLTSFHDVLAPRPVPKRHPGRSGQASGPGNHPRSARNGA